jgi:alkaline phosphatase D
MNFTRRCFTRTLAASALPGIISRTASAQASGPFQHGVASGDPLPDRVILWTRVTPMAGETAIPVSWTVATDPQLRNVIASGEALAAPNADYTVKVDAVLPPSRNAYYYGFRARGVASPTGRTRLLPTGAVDRVRYAVCSCSNYPYGYFNAYRNIANRPDLDFVIHLGDYIYEYGNATYGDGAGAGRIPDPDQELITLSDYRRRYAQYRTDPDLQEVHRQNPFLIVWDDHESANDAWYLGAENHSAGEGNWADRLTNSVQAWYEWQPVRMGEVWGSIYRSFAYGDLLDMILLDTRIGGRDQQLAPSDQGILSPDRRLLGADQEAWWFRQMGESQARGTAWRFIGQQVMMGQLFNTDGTPFNSDQWDGYLASRLRFLAFLRQASVRNVVVLTGDIHSSWANEITANPFDSTIYNASTGQGSQAVELVTPGITSPGLDDAVAPLFEAQIRATHPHVKYVNLNRRGYLLVDLQRDRMQAEWYHVRTVAERTTDETMARAMRVETGTDRLVVAAEATTPRTGAPPLAP